MKVWLVDSGTSVSLINFKMLKEREDAKQIVPYNNSVLAARVHQLNSWEKLNIFLVQMNPKHLDFLHEVFSH